MFNFFFSSLAQFLYPYSRIPFSFVVPEQEELVIKNSNGHWLGKDVPPPHFYYFFQEVLPLKGMFWYQFHFIFDIGLILLLLKLIFELLISSIIKILGTNLRILLWGLMIEYWRLNLSTFVLVRNLGMKT